MKNSRYYPFERNRYFYGKLLTVRDFESEQKYFNDKRRLLNRLLFGTGVISGLQVIAVDDKTISVEMGVALDSLGREIIVPSPVTLKLSTIEGFLNNEYAKNVYLCIAYDEKGKEPVHSVANSSVRSEEINEYNRIFESYKIFVREEAPDPSSLELANLKDSIQVLYTNSTVRIYQYVPRYIRKGDLFELTLVVEKALQTPKLFFEYELESTQFELVDSTQQGKITFSEPLEGQETQYTLSFLLKAKQGYTEGVGLLSMKPGSAILKIGDRQLELGTEAQHSLESTTEEVQEKILQRYFERTLDQSLDSSETCIYLAKISLLQMGATYMIEHVQPFPFQEYIYNPTALYKLDLFGKQSSRNKFLTQVRTERLASDQEPRLEVEYDEDIQQFNFTLGLPREKAASDDLATGLEEIQLKQHPKQKRLFAKNEQRYFSDEIKHGLGKGPICIVTALEEQNDDQISGILSSNEQLYFGDALVFKGSEYESKAANLTIGTILYPKKGTFRIGIKVEEGTDLSTVRIRWWALRKPVDDAPQLRVSNAYQEIASTKDEGPI